MAEIVGEKGDLDAEPGSKPWAVGVKVQLLYLLNKANSTERNITPYLEKIEETEAYKQLANENGEPFQSAAEFYAAPRPFGLNGDLRAMGRVSQAERARIAARLTDGSKVLSKGNKTGSNQYQNKRVEIGHWPISTQEERAAQAGISPRSQRRLDYIAKNAPDLLEPVRQGEMTIFSAYNKAKGAKAQVTITLDPEKAAKALKQHLSKDELKKLIELLKTE